MKYRKVMMSDLQLGNKYYDIKPYNILSPPCIFELVDICYDRMLFNMVKGRRHSYQVDKSGLYGFRIIPKVEWFEKVI